MKLGTWRAGRIGIVSLLWLVAVPLATIVAVGAWLQRHSASGPAADYLNALPPVGIGRRVAQPRLVCALAPAAHNAHHTMSPRSAAQASPAAPLAKR